MKNVKYAWMVVFAIVCVVGALPLDAATGQERHCVARASEDSSLDKVPTMECFDTFADAIVAATDGAVWLADGDLATQADQLEKALAQLEAPTVVVIAVDYADASYLGNTLTWQQTSGCSSSLSYYANSMPSGWNDRISSTRAYTNCNKNTVFEHSNRTGASLTCAPNCSNLGVMNDATSSRQWRY